MHPHGDPQIDPPKTFFGMAQASVPVFFDINRHLTEKYFDIVRGCHSPREPHQNGPPKINFLNGLTLRASVF